VIYSPGGKNNSYIRVLQGTSSVLFNIGSNKSPHSTYWPMIVLHDVQDGFLFVSSHGFPISAGSLFLLRLGRPGPFFPSSCKLVQGSFESRQLPIFLSGTVPTTQGHCRPWLKYLLLFNFFCIATTYII
jgi:hypothetical protein